jgi:hypothetical protein
VNILTIPTDEELVIFLEGAKLLASPEESRALV